MFPNLQERRMSQDELAAAVGRLGRPMTRQIIGKTEAGDRRIDVDDLVAFAVALGVTPGRLLLPGTAESAAKAWHPGTLPKLIEARLTHHSRERGPHPFGSCVSSSRWT